MLGQKPAQQCTQFGVVVDDDRAAVSARDARGDGQTEARAGAIGGAGVVEAGEALEATLVREIKEELNVDVSVLRQFDRTTTGEIDLVCFAAELTGEKPTTSTDHSELRWVPESELSKLDWARPDLPALQKLLIPYC